MASTVTPQRTQTPDDETDKGRGEYTEEIVEEVPVVVEWDHEPILHTVGSLPKATGSIPPTFTTSSFATQRQTALEYYSFLRSDNPQFLKLNEGIKVYTILVSIPKSKLVKVVFCSRMEQIPSAQWYRRWTTTSYFYMEMDPTKSFHHPHSASLRILLPRMRYM